ncbi:putative aminotransferase [Caballeronia udeis]|uniref:Putative aminotransferase n=1 Tax=Caballeronia udeis TaxID=1232866 RepID=A0A158H1E2_9BURK|nr:aminotransferase class III-fold pyridoxal phosphate-dependent enzyme [Caballeronia udeis]SAL37530.1 putative aminotransferase [Caballeronia udeis]
MDDIESGASALLDENDRHVFHRDVNRTYKVAMKGVGATFFDHAGKSYLDGSSGSFVCNLGHGIESIAKIMAEQASRITFTNTRNFTSEPELRLCKNLAALSPMSHSRVWVCSSGTAANEAATKMAYQYHTIRGNPGKTEVISRWRSYHGSSMAALAMTGDLHKRAPFEALLAQRPHIDPPYCFRCPWGKKRSSCALECTSALETEILRLGPDKVSAVIKEVIAGAPLGALEVPDGYLQEVRTICDKYDVLLIVDEVISGVGRTGAWFATSRSGVVPDLITLGKGLAGGFSPVGALVVAGKVFEAFSSSGRNFVHYETFTGHALSACVANAVIEHIQRNDLLTTVERNGRYLGQLLQALRDLRIVGDIRGTGFLWAVELVEDNLKNEPFSSDLRISDLVVDRALECGVLLIAGRGAADGLLGDTVLLAPPM